MTKSKTGGDAASGKSVVKRTTIARKKNILEQPHATTLLVDPDKLVIPGPEYGDGLYQPERNELPPEAHEVEEAMRPGGGIHTSVLAFRDGAEKLVVIDGRQRVKIAREANRRLAETGSEHRIRVPVRIKRGTIQEFALVSLVANLHRKDPDPITVARGMQFLIDSGKSEPEVGDTCGLKRSQVKNYLKLLDLCDEGRSLVSKGQMTMTAALKLADEPRAEQKKILKKAEENREAGVGPKYGIKRALDRRLVVEVAHDELLSEEVRFALLWALNEIDDADAFPKVEGLAGAVDAAKKRGEAEATKAEIRAERDGTRQAV